MPAINLLNVFIFTTENQPGIVANGTHNNGNNFQVAGVPVNSPTSSGLALITPNEQSVKEVQIQSNPYSAENGRGSGAQVLVVSQTARTLLNGMKGDLTSTAAASTGR